MALVKMDSAYEVTVPMIVEVIVEDGLRRHK